MVYGFGTEESIALLNLRKLSTSSPDGDEKRATLKEVKELGGFRVSDRHRPFLPTPVQLMCSAVKDNKCGGQPKLEDQFTFHQCQVSVSVQRNFAL